MAAGGKGGGVGSRHPGGGAGSPQRRAPLSRPEPGRSAERRPPPLPSPPLLGPARRREPARPRPRSSEPWSPVVGVGPARSGEGGEGPPGRPARPPPRAREAGLAGEAPGAPRARVPAFVVKGPGVCGQHGGGQLSAGSGRPFAPAPPRAALGPGAGRADLAVLGLQCLPATPGATVPNGAAFLLPLPA